MSVIKEATLERTEKVSRQSRDIYEVIYTICPTLVASHIAAEKGWLEKEFKKVGFKLKFLRSLPKEQWLPHFNHKLPNLFRDGGNIPPIWAKSEGEDTKLVGLTSAGDGGQILVRVDSGINKVGDLKGRKIGLTKRVAQDRVDFARATAYRGILLALDLAGLKESDVEIVDLPEVESRVGDPSWKALKPAQKPSELWGSGKLHNLLGVDSQALLDGQVDAIYANRSKTIKLESEGKVKAIEDLGRYPDWTVRVANAPTTITVNTALAEKHPEVVIAYLKAAIRSGRWIKSHLEEAAGIFIEVTGFSSVCAIAKELSKHDYVPNLSAKGIAGIEIEKEFLLESGYITNDFEVGSWVDNRFLEEALKQS